MAEWDASEYNRVSSLQQAMAREQLAQLHLEGAEHILDVGCGDGRITAQIAERVPRGLVVGVDPSQNMIDFASTHYGSPIHPNLQFEVGKAQQLRFQSQFDLVVSFNALHWVQDQANALRSIRNALKPTGRALLRFVSKGPRTSLEGVIEEVRRSPRWTDRFAGFQQPFAHFTPDEYRALAEANGLQVVKIEAKDKAWDFETRDAFLAFSRATFVEWTQKLPANEHHEFMVAVLDRYQAVAADNPAEANVFKFYQMESILTPRAIEGTI